MTEPETFLFEDDGAIPNSTLPLLVYRAAAPADPTRHRTNLRRQPLAAGLARRRASVPPLPRQHARSPRRRPRLRHRVVRRPQRTRAAGQRRRHRHRSGRRRSLQQVPIGGFADCRRLPRQCAAARPVSRQTRRARPGRAENRRRPAARRRSGDRRRWSVAPPLGQPSLRERSGPRTHVIEQFLQTNGFALRDARPLAQDASFRRYLRLPGAVLMDAPPPEDVRPFLRIAAHLAGTRPVGAAHPRRRRSRRPGARGRSRRRVCFPTILTEANAEPLFDAAIDALVVLHRAAPPAGLPEWGKAAMRETALRHAVRLVVAGDAWRPAAARCPRRDRRRARHHADRGRDRPALPRAPRLLRRQSAVAAASATALAGPGSSTSSPPRSGIRPTTSCRCCRMRGATSPPPGKSAPSRAISWRVRNSIRQHFAPPTPSAPRNGICGSPANGCGWRNATARPQYLEHGPRTWRLLTRALSEPAAAPLAVALDRFVPQEQRRNPPGLTA